VAKDASKADPFVDVMQRQDHSAGDATIADKAYMDNVSHLENAWQGEKKEA
jgi:hypothetical protein